MRFGDRDSLNSCSDHGGNSSGPNLRLVRTQDIQGEERSKRLEVGRIIVGNTPEGARLANYLPLEMWECRVVASNGAQRWERSLAGWCGVTVSIQHTPEWLSKLPGPGESLRMCAGMDSITAHPQFWECGFSGGPCRGSSCLLRSCHQLTGWSGVTYRTAWAVEPRCRCSYAYGRRVAVGPQTGERSWEFLCDLWRAVAPLFAPWCAEGEMPTCANLNHYGGEGSCVRWHRDDEALFGEQGESKLIVSVSIGYSALFRWKPRSSPDSVADSCWLHHGDLLVMDGRCQDEYLHCTDPRLDGERVNITYRWLKNHLPQCPVGTGVVCCFPTCVRGSSVSVCAGFHGSGWELDTFPVVLAWVGDCAVGLPHPCGTLAPTEEGGSIWMCFFHFDTHTILGVMQRKILELMSVHGDWVFLGVLGVLGSPDFT